MSAKWEFSAWMISGWTFNQGVSFALELVDFRKVHPRATPTRCAKLFLARPSRVRLEMPPGKFVEVADMEVKKRRGVVLITIRLVGDQYCTMVGSSLSVAFE